METYLSYQIKVKTILQMKEIQSQYMYHSRDKTEFPVVGEEFQLGELLKEIIHYYMH